MNQLSAQQQKIIQHLCQTRKPSNVKEIAENCFSSQNTISKQMTILVRLKYVEAAPAGKETFYELSEPLLRICFEFKEGRSKPIKLFVDFLGNLYSAEEIKNKYVHFRELYEEQSYYKEALKKYYPDVYNLILSTLESSEEAVLVKEPQLEYGAAEITGEKIDLIDLIVEIFEDILTSLFIHGYRDNISTSLTNLQALIESQNYIDPFFKAMPHAIFNILIQHEKIETNRFEFIETILNETFKENDSMIVPLKFLNIGIRHLKKKEKNTLFQFTKEERNTFQKFVLDKIK
jgi:hypothetical protein